MQGTLQTLERLHERDLLSTTEYKRLAGAYQFLRRLEHILQMEDDRQTHALPSDLSELERVAMRMSPAWHLQRPDISAATHLLKELNEHLENVQAIYERIVRAQRPLHYALQHAGPGPENSGNKQTDPPVKFSEDLLAELNQAVPRLTGRLRERNAHRAEERLARFLQSAGSSRQLELWTAILFWRIGPSRYSSLVPFLPSS